MADKLESLAGGDAGWSKIRRSGNDEVPTDRNAVKIIRTVRTQELESASKLKSKVKSAPTKVAKLIYEPKTEPTKGVVRSVHSFRSNKRPEVLNRDTQDKAFSVKATNVNTNENKELSNRKDVKKQDSERITKRSEGTKRDYILKKQERQNEVEEIKRMLSQINNFTDEMSKGIQLSNDENKEIEGENLAVEIVHDRHVLPVPPINISRRSKTDTDIPSLTSRFKLSNTPTTTRKSTRTTRSKSSSNIPVDEPVKKKKSYNPEEAKKFMEEQRKKRKEIGKLSKVDKTSIDREEIKKRLDDLRKSSLRILDNNLKKGKKKTKTLDIVPSNVTHIIEKGLPTPEPPKEIKAVENTSEAEGKSTSCFVKDMPVNDPGIKHPVTSNAVCKNDDISKKTDKELIVTQVQKDNIDKENISSNVALASTNNNPHVSENPGNNELELDHNDFKGKSKSEETQITPVEVKSKEEIDELNLSVPKVTLKTKVSFREKSVQVDTPKPEKPPIPYWLKPTPVQIYPYNFIMAVRKKLEAIANPVLIAKRFEDPHNTNIEATPLTHARHSRQKCAKRKLTGQLESAEEKSRRYKIHEEKSSSNSEGYTSFPSSSSRKDSQILDNQQNRGSSQKSSSVAASNFSSISMHLPVSNTISEISSIRSEGHRSVPAQSNTKISRNKSAPREDDTTISSSVFSSPEKRLPKGKKPEQQEIEKVVSEQDISPLSVENIKKLQIKSKAISDGITTSRGDKLDFPSIKPVPSEKPKFSEEIRTSDKSDTISEFEQLLEDFNKSLTQVIEVNHQIKTALNNTPQLSDNDENNLKISQRIPKKAPSVDSAKSKPEDYSSDFEEALSTSDTKKKNSSNESVAKSRVSRNFLEEIEDLTNSKSGSSDIEIKSNQSKEPVPATKKSSGSSISTQMSEFTTRQKDDTLNESQVNLKPFDSAKSATPPRSFTSEEFLDSIEEMSKLKTSSAYGKPNIPEVPDNSINPQNMSTNQFSKDSLDLGGEEYSQVNFFQGHVNVSRGDFMYYKSTNKESPDKVPPAYEKLEHQKNSHNASLGSSEIFAIFNQSDIELSVVSQTGSLSETTLNYSSLGLYEQLLKAENNKSEQLLMLLKMREKALMDRTKGQIAWLEVQKEKYKAKGLTPQISAIKKKQRAILLKMEREREEIKKMLQSKSNKQEKSKLIRPLLSSMSDIAIRKNTSFTSTSSRSTIVKGQELQPNHSLEKILQKREEELKKRRAHVEHLIEWHKRLDKEEEEILQMEHTLLDYNSQIKSPKVLKKQKRIEDIDNSIKELQNISSRSDGSEKNSYVRATGQKLNKLWKRLTGLKEQKFEPTVKYKLSKNDLEELYEEAKITVLRDFGQEDEMKQLLDLSKFELTSNSNKSLDFDDRAEPQENNIKSAQSDVETALEKINGFEPLQENGVSSENASALAFESNAVSLKDSLSNKSNNVVSNEHSNVYIDSFKGFEANDKTYTTTRQENSSKEEVIQKESDPSSQPSDSSVANTESVLQTKVQNSDSDKIDTVAEVTSLSYDSNNSFEYKSKSSVNAQQTFIQEDNRVVDSDVESLHPLTVISNKQVSSDEENQQRSSVIISRISVETAEESDKENSSRETVETEVPSIPENSEEHYSESFISYESHQDSKVVDAVSDVTHSNASQRDTASQLTQIVSELIESVVDESSQEEKANNERLEKSPAQESLDGTLIEDISLPKFEYTAEESNSEVLEDILSPSKIQQQGSPELGVSTTELEKRLIDLDVSLKELDETFERALSPEKSPSPSHSRSPSQNFGEEEKENIPGNQVALNNSKQSGKNVKPTSDNAAILMPDIINEVEIRRRQQILLESDLKQLEHAVPYVFLREIPNKPPPPYVPPAHGSPMTTIFPPESRIQEISYRRVHELYEETTKTEINNHLKRPSIMDENITNIYERIILDICKEMMEELQPTFNPPNSVNYKNLLALFNPPNRLQCLQDHIYKHIRKLLGMDKKCRRRNAITAIGHKKRDPVDEILIQELYEEEYKWTNFDLEEAEVKETVVEEIFNDLLKEALDEIVDADTEQIQHTVLEEIVDL